MHGFSDDCIRDFEYPRWVLFSHITFHVLAKESHITLPRHFAFLKSHGTQKSCYLARFA